MKTPQELVDFIGRYSRFFILGHTEPDGDCLGSQTALASFLNRNGKTAVLCSAGPFTRPETKKLEHLFSSSIAQTATGQTDSEKADSAVIIVDCSTPERIGDVLASEIRNYPVAVIDHHASGQKFGDCSWVDGASPSTTIMIYNLIRTMGERATEEEAEDLLFGFLTDTGYFRHLDSSHAEYLGLAAELLGEGASLKDLYYRMYGGRKLESKILSGIILSRARPVFDGRCIMIYETLEEKEKYGAENRDSDTIYSQLFSVKGCEAVVFVREETEDTCSVSLRSLKTIDVGSIAASLGGGGHKFAAGLEWNGGRLEIENRLTEVLKEFLN